MFSRFVVRGLVFTRFVVHSLEFSRFVVHGLVIKRLVPSVAVIDGNHCTWGLIFSRFHLVCVVSSSGWLLLVHSTFIVTLHFAIKP